MASRYITPVFDGGKGVTPADGLQLFFFSAGTSSPKDTYTTEAATIANSNPVISDGNGVFPDIWITGSYKVQFKNKNGVGVGFVEADPVNETVGVGDSNNDKRYGPTFATVAAMTAANPVSIDGVVVTLVSGMTVSTQGYRDGWAASAVPMGPAVYDAATLAEVRAAKSDGAFVPDELGDHTAGNGIVLMLRVGDSANLYQHGATGDGVTDDTLNVQSALDTLKPLCVPIGTFVCLDAKMKADGQNIIGESRTRSILLGATGVIVRNYDGADAGSASYKNWRISNLTFKGGYTYTFAADQLTKSGTAQTLTSTNIGVLVKLSITNQIDHCNFENLHDGFIVHAGITSNFHDNEFSDIERGMVFTNGTFWGDPAFKNTSTSVTDNYMRDGFFGLYAVDVVDNITLRGNTFEKCNTCEYLFNVNGVTSENYHEFAFEGLYCDGGFFGDLVVGKRSFFGGTPGSFWGSGNPIFFKSSIAAAARIHVENIQGPDAKPWIGTDLAAASQAKIIQFRGFEDQEPNVEFIPAPAEQGSSATFATIYFNQADRFEVIARITSVNAATPTTMGSFKFLLDPAVQGFVEQFGQDAAPGSNQGATVFVGASFFQITNKAAMTNTQSMELYIKRILVGTKD